MPVSPQFSPHQVARLVGRDRHLELLEAALADMCRARTVALFIHGPSGIGKTALVRRFLENLTNPDRAVVLSGRCHERESVPYKALDSVIDALSRYLRRLPLLEAQALLPRDIRSLVRVFPALQEAEAVATAPRLDVVVADPQELRRRAFHALRELFSRPGDRRPLILAIDDLQWGDSDSAAVLLELLRPPDSPRLLLLGCYRSEDASTSALLQALIGDREAPDPRIERRDLALDTLDPAESEGLALALLGREDQAARALAESIGSESGGNPFFVAELVRFIQADGGLRDHAPATGEIALDDVLWARARRLPDEGRRLLELIAVSGRPIGQAEACQAADFQSGERTALSLLRSARMILTTSPTDRDEIETYHDRVREAIVAHLTPSSLQDHHRRLAKVLESSGDTDPEVLAVHFQGARDSERAAVYFASAAAQAAEALAFDRAVKLYRSALELTAADDSRARRLRVGLGNALVNAGRGAEAAREYLIAADGATIAEGFELRRLAAIQFLICGHLDEGLAELGAVLRAAGMSLPATPARAILSLIAGRLLLRFRGLRFRRRDPNQVPAKELSRIDVGWSVATGLGIVDPIRGAAFQTHHLRHALHAGEPFRIARGWLFVLNEARERGDRHMVTNLSTFLMSTMRLAEDDPEGALDEMRQAMNKWTQWGFHVQHNEWYGAELQIKLYQNDGQGAWNFIVTRYAPAPCQVVSSSAPKTQDLFLRKMRSMRACRSGRCGRSRSVYSCGKAGCSTPQP